MSKGVMHTVCFSFSEYLVYFGMGTNSRSTGMNCVSMRKFHFLKSEWLQLYWEMLFCRDKILQTEIVNMMMSILTSQPLVILRCHLSSKVIPTVPGENRAKKKNQCYYRRKNTAKATLDCMPVRLLLQGKELCLKGLRNNLQIIYKTECN